MKLKVLKLFVGIVFGLQMVETKPTRRGVSLTGVRNYTPICYNLLYTNQSRTCIPKQIRQETQNSDVSFTPLTRKSTALLLLRKHWLFNFSPIWNVLWHLPWKGEAWEIKKRPTNPQCNGKIVSAWGPKLYGIRLANSNQFVWNRHIPAFCARIGY